MQNLILEEAMQNLILEEAMQNLIFEEAMQATQITCRWNCSVLLKYRVHAYDDPLPPQILKFLSILDSKSSGLAYYLKYNLLGKKVNMIINTTVIWKYTHVERVSNVPW